MEPIPAETVAAVRAATGLLTDGIVEAIRAENPAYAEVLAAPEGIGIRLGIEQAIGAFLDAVERGDRPAGGTAEVWRRLGEAEFQAGRNLDALRAAWRTGTRAAWRGAADLAASAGMPTQTVIALAEAIFVFTDELATDVVEGYLRIQSDQAGEHERRRRRLATLLLDAEGADPEAVAHAAELARWPLPRNLAVLALDAERPGEVARRLDVDALVASEPSGALLVLPDPEGPGRGRALNRALGGLPAALGPTVPPREAARSLRWARLGLGLVATGALPSESPTRVSDHLTSVILLRDEDMAVALVQRALGPLERLPQPERERLLETLAAWLAHQRHTPGIAAELHVHPQTVRYRIGKLRELLGEALDTAHGRLELELALRARAVLQSPIRSGP
jgi:PucR C-terminal helix-turn-helix domain